MAEIHVFVQRLSSYLYYAAAKLGAGGVGGLSALVPVNDGYVAAFLERALQLLDAAF